MKRFLVLLAVGSAFSAPAAIGGAQADTSAAPRPRIVAPAAASANYLADLENTHRWRGLPVRVFFQKNGAYSSAREQAARAGFAQWTDATSGVIGYTLVPTQKQADVIVRFTSGSYVPPDPNALGVTAYSTRGPYLYKALMTLATGGNSTLPELTSVAAHEWGHALGIHGHSKTESDLMYGVTTRYISLNPDFVPPPARAVGTRDANTLKAIYALRPKP